VRAHASLARRRPRHLGQPLHHAPGHRLRRPALDARHATLDRLRRGQHLRAGHRRGCRAAAGGGVMTGPAGPVEEILEPELPIVDPHHHLWDRRAALAAAGDDPARRHGFLRVIDMAARYLLDELLEDTGSGHNVAATVFVDGVAAMCASGTYGSTLACAGIVGHADLRLPPATLDEVLEAHVAAGGGRFRGIRHSASHHADPEILGPLHGRAPEGLY